VNDAAHVLAFAMIHSFVRKLLPAFQVPIARPSVTGKVIAPFLL
jgi:hypothetical protein